MKGKSLEKIFNEYVFRIPDYQRGYAWLEEGTNTQLSDFWEDLNNAQTPYSLGMLTIKRIDPADFSRIFEGDLWITKTGRTPMHVLDGQQRLTTCLIVIFEMLKEIERRDPSGNIGEDTNVEIEKRKFIYRKQNNTDLRAYLFGYNNQESPSAKYLRFKIFEEPYPLQLSTSFYTKNLEAAKIFFHKKIEEQSLQNLKELYIKLTRKFQFLVHEMEDDVNIFVTFEAINNRGKKLSTLEQLKNRLMYLSTQYPEEQGCQLRQNINEAWTEIYTQLGRDPNGKALDDEDFLRIHWIMFFGYCKRNYKTFLLKDKFTLKSILDTINEKNHITSTTDEENRIISQEEPDDDTIETEEEKIATTTCTFQDISDYVSSLRNSAQYWYAINLPENNDVNLSNEEKELLQQLKLINNANFLPLLLAVLCKQDKSQTTDRCKLFQTMERFLFICSRINIGARADYQRIPYYKVAHDFFKDSVTINKILLSLENDINERMPNSVNNFISGMKERFIEKKCKDGFYGWNWTKYLLYQYEKSLEKYSDHKHDQIAKEFFNKTNSEQVTLEHIFPQHATNNYWKENFANLPSKQVYILTHSLGNLLPLSLRINQQLQNDSYDDKIKEKKDKAGNTIRRGYQNGCLSEQEVANTYKKWTPSAIKKRSQHLLCFMRDHWQIPSLTEKLIEELTDYKKMK